MAIGAVNLARLPGVIRCPVVQHRQGWTGNRDASLSLLRRRGACATGACGLHVCVARRDLADSAFRPRVADSIGCCPRTLLRNSVGHGRIGCTPRLALGSVRTGKACPSDCARHLRQHPSNGRIMKRAHAGGPRATSMESLGSSSKDRKQRNQTALKSQKSALLGSHSHPPVLFPNQGAIPSCRNLTETSPWHMTLLRACSAGESICACRYSTFARSALISGSQWFLKDSCMSFVKLPLMP